MIVVDSSALVAVQFGEAEGPALVAALIREPEVVIGAPTALEYQMVAVGRKGEAALQQAQRLLEQFNVEVLNFTPVMQQVAIDAFLRFGKGHHAAGLNFGDCMSYAVAKALDSPLLFKGKDFARTDVRPALV